MSKNILSTKQLVLLLIAVCVTTSLLVGFSEAIVDMARRGADWQSAFIAALGDIIGGLLGGIVAFIVASYQVQKAFLYEERKQKIGSASTLKLIKEELNTNALVLQSAIPYDADKYHLLTTQLTNDAWQYINHIVAPGELLIKLNRSYRKINLIRNLKQEQIQDSLLHKIKLYLDEIVNFTENNIKEIEADLKNE